MDAASVLAPQLQGSPRTRLAERRLQAFVQHSGLSRRNDSSPKNAGVLNLNRRVSPSKNAGVQKGGRENHISQRGVKLCLAMLLFTSAWVLTYLFMRGYLQSFFEPTSFNGNGKARAGPSIQRLDREVYSSYKTLQATARHKIARISSYLQTTVLPSNVHGSTGIPSRTLLPSTGMASTTSNGIDKTEVPVPVEPQQSPISSQEVKNPPSQMSRPQNRSTPLPLRDFALNAEYISGLTSHTHSNLGLRQRFGLKVFSSIAGFDVGRTLGQSPTMALMDGGSNEQSCWLFPGKSGHLGIRLKERISVDKFTIDHLPREMLSDFAILQAPRKMILWGRVDGPENSVKAEIYRKNMGDELSGLSLASRFFGRKTYRREDFIPLTTFEYKLSGQAHSNVQTKELPRTVQSLQMDFQVVVLEIVSNWGAPSTCLYRVRVHGDPLKAVALRTSP